MHDSEIPSNRNMEENESDHGSVNHNMAISKRTEISLDSVTTLLSQELNGSLDQGSVRTSKLASAIEGLCGTTEVSDPHRLGEVLHILWTAILDLAQKLDPLDSRHGILAQALDGLHRRENRIVMVEQV